MIRFRFLICDLRFRLQACCIVLATLMCAATSDGATSNNFFAKGVAAYQAGAFRVAGEDFENAATNAPAPGALDNWGLAEWHRGHAGPAILAWERARWLAPSDPRAGENLRFARQVMQLDTPQLKWFEAVSAWLPSTAWAWLTAIGLWLAAGMMILPTVFRRRKAGWHQALAAAGLCLFLFSVTADVGTASRTGIGFVLEKNAPLLLTPTRDGEVTTTLTAGEPARRLRTRGNYYLIRTDYGTGWIAREEFGLVCPD